MIITKTHLAAAECVAGKDDDREALRYVYFKDGVAISMDGHIIVKIEDKDNKQLGDQFPDIGPKQNRSEHTLLKIEEIEKIKKLLPKKVTQPILSTIKIAQGKNGAAELVIPDLDNPTVIESKQDHGFNAYDYDRFLTLNRGKENGMKIRLSYGVLIRLLNLMKKVSAQHVDFMVYKDEPLSPIDFTLDNEDNLNITGILMPMRY